MFEDGKGITYNIRTQYYVIHTLQPEYWLACNQPFRIDSNWQNYKVQHKHAYRQMNEASNWERFKPNWIFGVHTKSFSLIFLNLSTLTNMNTNTHTHIDFLATNKRNYCARIYCCCRNSLCLHCFSSKLIFCVPPFLCIHNVFKVCTLHILEITLNFFHFFEFYHIFFFPISVVTSNAYKWTMLYSISENNVKWTKF